VQARCSFHLFAVCLPNYLKGMQSSKEERRPAAWGIGDREALFAGLPLGGGETLGLPVTESQAIRQTQAQQRSVIQ